MFCHECSYAVSTGERYVLILFGSGREVVCLECAVTMGWLSHGQPVYEHGRECRTCGEPTCHDCSSILTSDERTYAESLVRRWNAATAPYVPRTDHAHRRCAQLARAIKARLGRMGARLTETESGRMRLA